MAALKSCAWSFSRCCALVAALVALPVSLLAQSISGTVVNNSTWLNDAALLPPQWHVAANLGTVVPGQGRVMVALFLSSDLENRIDSLPLAPANMITLVDLSTIIGSNWAYSLGNLLEAGNYRVIAWIDGNDNGVHDVGEPHGYANVRISGESSVNNIKLTIREDSDLDGMEDWWEAHWFGDLSQAADMDYDNDGLSNIQEYDLIHTAAVYVRPDHWDTDGDGMDDAWEVFYGLDPTSAVGGNGASGDPDVDGISNIAEYVGPDSVGWRRDANRDGIAEFTTSTDAMNPTDGDSDRDGVSDDDEFLDDLTHPVHPMSGTNFTPRSLGMNVNAGAGASITDPTGNTFALGYGGGTVECWVYPQTDGNGVLVSFPAAEAAGLDHFRISLDDFRPKLQILTGAAVQATVGGTGVAGSVQQLEPGQWNHLAFVIAPENKSLSIHLNGVLLIAQTVLISLDYAGTPTICRDFTDGYLDELRIWSYPRPVSDIEYWASRYYPAPGYVQLSADTRSGRTVQMYDYSDPHPLMLYLRFDDGGDAVENFAFLNHGLYPYPDTYRISGPITAAVTADQAVPMFGSDDADGDELPEWWVDLHNMEKYQEYYTSAYGPVPVWCPDNAANLLGFEYYRSFVGYASIGNRTGWNEEGSTVFHMPKTSPDFFEGDNSTYTKHVYLFTQPRSCPLSVYTPGMTSTVVYVNGEQVTTTGDEGNQGQQYDVAQYMRIGRNTVHIQCKSTTILTSYNAASGVIAGLPYTISDYQAYSAAVTDTPLGCDENPYRFKVARGKFDAELTCNGMPVIVRGDKTRADARAAWHVQLWSSLFESVSHVPLPDREHRDARSNPDYGVPLHAERDNNLSDPDVADDGLDAVYEFICGTNPRERESNNNGVSDGDEDYDSDGLVNREEQRFGSSPWLADTDDDGLHDGIDVGDGHPAQSLSPQRNQSLRFGGGAGDYISIPLQQRFALEKWSIEAWIRPDADETDGGILARRSVGGTAVNYEVGLNAANRPYARYVSVAGVEVIVTGSAAVVADGLTWTHVAATYYDRRLNLFINGTNVASQTGGSFPALYAGGPVQQRIGAGFKGCIDEWRLWSTELTRARILANLEEVLTGLEPELVAYYRFDDGTSHDPGLPLVGTSANNGTNGALPVVAWRWGQVEDNVLRYASDWWLQWKHAASFAGNVSFSTNHIMQGPPQLQVFIENNDAVTAGARWSYNGGASWNVSGFVETHLAAGDYDISFNTIDGWISPVTLPLTLVRGQSTMATGTYVRTASLTVIIDNNAAIKEVATWSIDGGGTRRGSGTQVLNLVPGAPGYDILFSDISAQVPGWDRPATFNVQLLPGEPRTVSASYTAVQGALQVSFTPTNAPSAARWRVSGNTNWWASGETVTNLAYGEHLLEYNSVAWWKPPTNETVVIAGSYLHTLSRAWEKLPEPSTITVTITPPGAITDGAWWGVNGSWYSSGQTVVVEPGSHVVTYRTVSGWLKPMDLTLDAINAAAQATGTYYRVDIAGSAENGGFKTPWGIATTPRLVYVADSGNNRIQVLDRVTGKWMTIGSAGTAAGQFKQPLGVALAPNGDVWVADTGNHRVQRLSKKTGAWTTFGTYGKSTGQFNAPYDLAVDAAGHVYVADYHNSRVQKRQASGAWSVIIQGGTQDGRVRYPSGVAVSAGGSLYISDYDPTGEGFSGRVQKFTTGGGFLERSGTSEVENGGLNQNMGLGLMPDGSLLSANTFDNEILVRDGTGNWNALIVDGVVKRPRDVDADTWGNVVIADSGNNRVLILPADDADRDGLPDALEATYGTLPGTADSDGDGFKDGVEVLLGTDPANPASFPVARLDFDGDGVSDYGCYDATGLAGLVLPGQWFFMRSRLGFDGSTRFGYPGTIPLVGDFDGDGLADYGCYDPNGVPGSAAQGSWYLMTSSAGFKTYVFGYPGTVPVVGDFDGDGVDDFGCYDAKGIPGVVAPGSWYFMMSTAGFKTDRFGYPGTVPVVGDFDGDGRADYGCYDDTGVRGVVPPGSWYFRMSTAGFKTYTFGYPGTVPVVGDFDGDGTDDFGCYDAVGISGSVSPGQWYFMKSASGFSKLSRFGHYGAVPVIGDFDGDGRDDPGLYNAAGLPGVSEPGTWSFLRSSAGPGSTRFGYGGTVPATGNPAE